MGASNGAPAAEPQSPATPPSASSTEDKKEIKMTTKSDLVFGDLFKKEASAMHHHPQPPTSTGFGQP